MGAASFKSLYQKRPSRPCSCALLRAGRSRYSTKTLQDPSNIAGLGTGQNLRHAGNQLENQYPLARSGRVMVLAACRNESDDTECDIEGGGAGIEGERDGRW